MFRKIPDTLVIVFMILVVMTALTWIVDAGQFERTTLGNRSDIVVKGSYHATEAQPQGPWDLMVAPFKGFADGVSIIAFVLLVGGAFGVIMATGAIDTGLSNLIRITQARRRARMLMLALIMLLFSLCGFTFGMSEESLVFVLITIPLARNMGYDALVGISIPFLTSGIGGAAAAYNPFAVGVAMQIAGVPFPSGVGLRTIVWLILTGITIWFVLRYARRIEKDPSRSLLYGLSANVVPPYEGGSFTWGKILVIVLFVATLVFIPFGAGSLDWGVNEIGAAFLALGFLSAAAVRMSGDRIVQHFTEGARAMLPAALVICISRSVLIVARDGQIIDTMLYHLSNSLEGLAPVIVKKLGEVIT
ncbi:MAG: YfcC family protein, partial [Flavobacteriales bacterium]|nr:YfcC family protein [Flavobacteriales bacterium]